MGHQGVTQPWVTHGLSKANQDYRGLSMGSSRLSKSYPSVTLGDRWSTHEPWDIGAWNVWDLENWDSAMWVLANGDLGPGYVWVPA